VNVLIVTLLPLVTHCGVATQYMAEEHAGQPLICDRGDGLVYDENNPFAWVALQLDTFECWDRVTLYVDDWPDLDAFALDSGALDSRTFRGGLPVVADAPEHLAIWKNSVPEACVVNWSALARECIERGWCD